MIHAGVFEVSAIDRMADSWTHKIESVGVSGVLAVKFSQPPPRRVCEINGITPCPLPGIGRHLLGEFARVKQPRQVQLLHVVDARNPLRLGLGLGQRRQQHRRQNGNDGDDHQQFNERKTGFADDNSGSSLCFLDCSSNLADLIHKTIPQSSYAKSFPADYEKLLAGRRREPARFI